MCGRSEAVPCTAGRQFQVVNGEVHTVQTHPGTRKWSVGSAHKKE